MRSLFAVLAVLVCLAGSAQAATFNVNDTSDFNDANPGDGVCATAGATCTLRAAVTESNALAGRDTINVPAGTYTSASAYVFTDYADLIGVGRDVVTIQPAIQSGSNTVATDIHIEVVGVTTQIRVYDDLTLRDSTATSLGTRGYVEIAPNGLSNVRVHGSRLGTVAIERNSTASISDSVVENGGITLVEGAVFVERSSIVNSPIRSVHNTTGSRSDAVFINCTFTGANSDFNMVNPTDQIDINYCTFADGAQVNSPWGNFVVTNSIFRNGGAVTNCRPSVSAGYNLSDDATCGGRPTDRTNTNPLLGPLTVENGKPVYPLLPGSPAIDTAGALVRVDERGVGRPQGGGPDVGAYESCSACAPPRRWVRGDFNVDGRSDIFWFFTGNQKYAFWLMNGAAVLSSQYIEGDNHATSAARLADIDGDGDADIWTGVRPRFMENTAVRFRNSSNDFGVNYPGIIPPAALAVADFNGDGREDIMVRTGDTGAVLIYLMAGVYGMPRYAAVPPPEWEFIAAKDFDGDGRGDLIWRNTTTSEVVLWKMKDWFVTGTVSLASPNSDWQFLAAGDFTGDGRADLLWRNSQTAQIAQWEFDQNGALVSALIIAQTPQPWNVRAVGKLNDDSTDDLVWRQDGSGGNGDNAAWLMNPGGGILSSQYLVDVESLQWLMMGPM